MSSGLPLSTDSSQSLALESRYADILDNKMQKTLVRGDIAPNIKGFLSLTHLAAQLAQSKNADRNRQKRASARWLTQGSTNRPTDVYLPGEATCRRLINADQQLT